MSNILLGPSAIDIFFEIRIGNGVLLGEVHLGSITPSLRYLDDCIDFIGRMPASNFEGVRMVTSTYSRDIIGWLSPLGRSFSGGDFINNNCDTVGYFVQLFGKSYKQLRSLHSMSGEYYKTHLLDLLGRL